MTIPETGSSGSATDGAAGAAVQLKDESKPATSGRSTPAPKSQAGRHVDIKNKAAVEAFERLTRQSAKVADAQARLRRERDRLDEVIAHSVSTQPESITWYAHPGVLTIDQAVGANGGGYTAIHQAVQRYRNANRTSSGPRRNRGR